MTRLSEREIEAELGTLTGWTLRDGAIHKRFSFAGFPEAVAFVGRLVGDAERADHHPDVAISYRHVTITWTTHSDGGLTVRDFEGARMTERHVGSPA